MEERMFLQIQPCGGVESKSDRPVCEGNQQNSICSSTKWSQMIFSNNQVFLFVIRLLEAEACFTSLKVLFILSLC